MPGRLAHVADSPPIDDDDNRAVMNQMTRVVAAPPESFQARFTTAEFLRMCDSGAFEDWKVELVDGELERMQQPFNNHAMRQAQIVFLLAQAIGVELVRGEVGIDLGNDTVLACDAAVLHQAVTGNRRLRAEDLALAIEISETTLSRDLGMKRRKYAAARIPLYWVVDGDRSVIHVHAEPVDGDYADIHTVRFGQPLAVPGTDASIVLT